MDGKLFALIGEQTPQINPIIANGLAMEAMKGVELYIDKIIRSAAPGFPEGLEYGWPSKGIGYERCTPHEEYNRAVMKRPSNRSQYELARSDLYMIKLYFTFKGKELEPRYIYLPYVRDGGLIQLRGSTYAISPVLADRAISLGLDNMFVALPRAKLTFERKPHHFIADDDRHTVNVVHSQVHHDRRNSKRREGRALVSGNTTMVHYLLCKYGLKEMFRRFADAEVVVGTNAEIDEGAFPPEEWTICRSIDRKPRTVRTKYYVTPNIRIAIRNDDFGLVARDLMGGVFYVVDHFPQRVQPEHVDHLLMWRRLLGLLIWGGASSGEGKLIEDVNAHFNSLDEYIDEEARDMLKEDGVPCDDVYELFFHAIKVLSVLEVQPLEKVASMYDKYLMILRYTLFDVTSAIFNFMYQLKKNTRNEITEKDITDTMRRILTPELIMKLNHNHGEVNSVSSPGDNKYFKITSVMVQQTSSTGKGKNRSKSNTADPTKFLHSSISEVGSHAVLPKSAPDGRGRVNPFLHVSPNFKVEPNEAYREVLGNLQRDIDR